MKITYHQKNLTKIITDLSVLTGVTMAFYDAKKKPLFLPAPRKDFCSQVQCMDGMAPCYRSDEILLEKCTKSRQLEYHLCHTGLCDLALPVIKRDIIVGYVILGRLRTPETAQTPPERFASLEKLYKKTPLFNYEKLDCLKDLLPRVLFASAIEIEFDNFVTQVTDYIEHNLHEKLNIATICSKFHVSKDSLYEAFHSNFKCTVNEYISSRRLEKAKELLANTNEPIYLITESLGFENSTYFCQLFKKKEGVSPTAYRKKVREGDTAEHKKI